MSPDITVVIPYSQSHTPSEMLEDAKKSVNQQSVDTDLLVIEDKERNGPGWARNKGMSLSNTRYVAFLDADDLWKERKLQRQLDELSRTGAGLCVEGRTKSDSEFIRELLSGTSYALTPSILVDTQQVSTRFEESLERREDHLFMIEATAEAGACFCENLITVRKHSSGLSNKTDFETRYTSDLKFFCLATSRVSECRTYTRLFFKSMYYSLGRIKYNQEDYSESLGYLTASARFSIDTKTILAIGLTCLYFVRSNILNKIANVHELYNI